MTHSNTFNCHYVFVRTGGGGRGGDEVIDWCLYDKNIKWINCLVTNVDLFEELLQLWRNNSNEFQLVYLLGSFFSLILSDEWSEINQYSFTFIYFTLFPLFNDSSGSAGISKGAADKVNHRLNLWPITELKSSKRPVYKYSRTDKHTHTHT